MSRQKKFLKRQVGMTRKNETKRSSIIKLNGLCKNNEHKTELKIRSHVIQFLSDGPKINV